MDIQIQINLLTKQIIDFRTDEEVATTRPWGVGDITLPFKIIENVNIDPGETKEIFDGIEFSLPEDL